MARGGDQKRIAGAVFGVIGIILVVAALIVDKISGYYPSKSSDDTYSTCGWQKTKCESDFCVAIKYSKFCDDDNKYCDAETAGQCWLAFCILAIVGGVVGLGVEFGKRTKFTELSYFASMLFCILALISFFVNNGYCWHKKTVEDERQRLEASSIIMIVNCLVFLIAGVCSHDRSGYIKI